MPDDDPGGSAPPEPTLSPEEVASRTFATAFRGFDPVEVRAFLGQVADELTALLGRVGTEPPAPPPVVEAAASEPDPAVVEEALRTAREEADVLVIEAKERAVTIEADAEDRANRILAEARNEVTRLREEAQRAAAARAEEAEAAADQLHLQAEKEAASLRIRAREESDHILEAARQRGREMVQEAQAARERMLADLAKRKRAAQAQIEQLRAGRDRVLESLQAARRSIDDITVRFDAAEPGRGLADHSSPSPPPAAPVPLPAAPPPPAVERPSLPSAPAVARPRPSPTLITTTPPEPAPEPEPEAEPAVPDPQPEPQPQVAEERRSSALRILRRNKPVPAPERPELSQPPAGGDEGIRIIVPAAPVAAPSEDDVPQPQPEPEPEPEVVEVEAVDLADDEPAAADEPAAEVELELVDEPEPEAQPAPEPEPARPNKADELFARLKAERAEAVAKAQEVLHDDDPTAAQDEADDEPSPEPVSDENEAALQRRDTALQDLETQLVRKLKRAIQDEQNLALDGLRTARGALSADTVLPAADRQIAPYRELGHGFLEEAARAAAAASPFGAAVVGVDDLATALATEVAGSLRSRVQRVLEEAQGDNLELSEISDRIGAVYREWKGQHAAPVGVHHLLLAYGRGFFVAVPERTPLQWVVDDDGPCPDCDDNALNGPTPRGEPFPTGQLHPPAHVGCRCLVVPTSA